MQVQHRHILENHVIGPLQERRINGHHGNHARLGQAPRHGHRMALGNPHIKGPLGIGPLKGRQSGSRRHGGRDGTQASFPSSQLKHGISKRIGKGHGRDRARRSRLGIKRTNSMKLVRALLRRGVAAAFFGDYMKHNRTIQTLSHPQQIDHAL